MISELIQTRQLDYLFVYRAPILLGDDKAKTVFKGLRTEKLANAVRLQDVRHTSFGPDQLMRGRVVYPEKTAGGRDDLQPGMKGGSVAPGRRAMRGFPAHPAGTQPATGPLTCTPSRLNCREATM